MLLSFSSLHYLGLTRSYSMPYLTFKALQHILNGMQILCAREAVVAVLAPHGSPAPGYGAGAGGGSDMKKAGEAEAGNSNSATMTPAGTLTLEAAAEVGNWAG